MQAGKQGSFASLVGSPVPSPGKPFNSKKPPVDQPASASPQNSRFAAYLDPPFACCNSPVAQLLSFSKGNDSSSRPRLASCQNVGLAECLATDWTLDMPPLLQPFGLATAPVATVPSKMPHALVVEMLFRVYKRNVFAMQDDVCELILAHILLPASLTPILSSA